MTIGRRPCRSWTFSPSTGPAWVPLASQREGGRRDLRSSGSEGRQDRWVADPNPYDNFTIFLVRSSNIQRFPFAQCGPQRINRYPTEAHVTSVHGPMTESARADASVPKRSTSERSSRRRGWNARQAWEASARVRRSRAAAREPWGSLGDPTSRLGRLVAEIERQLRDEYDVTRPLWADNVRAAAEFRALAQRTRSLLGIDPRATLRSATAATAAAREVARESLAQRWRPTAADVARTRPEEGGPSYLTSARSARTSWLGATHSACACFLGRPRRLARRPGVSAAGSSTRSVESPWDEVMESRTQARRLARGV